MQLQEFKDHFPKTEYIRNILSRIDEKGYNHFVQALKHSNDKAPQRYKIEDVDRFILDNQDKILNLFELFSNNSFSMLNSYILDTPTPLRRFMDGYAVVHEPFLRLFKTILNQNDTNLSKKERLALCTSFSAVSHLDALIKEKNPTEHQNLYYKLKAMAVMKKDLEETVQSILHSQLGILFQLNLRTRDSIDPKLLPYIKDVADG